MRRCTDPEPIVLKRTLFGFKEVPDPCPEAPFHDVRRFANWYPTPIAVGNGVVATGNLTSICVDCGAREDIYLKESKEDYDEIYHVKKQVLITKAVSRILNQEESH